MHRAAQGGLARRAGAFIASMPDHYLLDRVVRGRAWIPLLGILLAGIVAAQVEILKLGATMGRALEQTTTLSNQNEQLRGSVAALADDQRIERLAANMGMVLPPPGAVGYLRTKADGDVSGALGNFHSPDAATFVALMPKNGALVTGAGTSTLPPAAGAPAPPPAATSTATSATGTSTATGTIATGTSTATGSTTATATATGPSAGGTTTTTPAQSTSVAPSTGATAPQTTSQTSATTSTPQVPSTPPPSSSGSSAGAAAIQPATSSQTTGGG